MSKLTCPPPVAASLPAATRAMTISKRTRLLARSPGLIQGRDLTPCQRMTEDLKEFCVLT